MRRALGFIIKGVVALGLLAAVGGGLFVWRSPDPEYTLYETVFRARFHRFDAVIQEAAKRRGVDPMLIKAVTWRESRFDPTKRGADGERGLMQITDAAAKEWAKGEKIANFVPTDLFDPKTNIEAGTWLLARALRRYEGRDDPMPFALAEYNAGRSRVARWSGEKDGSEAGTPVGSEQMMANVNIASTKNYVETVRERVRYYHRRGKL